VRYRVADEFRYAMNCEAVSEDEQAQLTQQAPRTTELQLRRQWGETHEAITAALDRFAAVDPPTLTSSIRAVRRSGRPARAQAGLTSAR
jgi:hypothetical protein